MEQFRNDIPLAFTVLPLPESRICEALELCWNVFCIYEAPDYSEEGVEEFRKTLWDPEYLSGLRYYGAINEADKLIGLLAVRESDAHICFFFVDGNCQRRGVGTALFRRMTEDFSGKTVTLNSAPFALPFYRKLGFAETDTEQCVNGIRFTPMEYRSK